MITDNPIEQLDAMRMGIDFSFQITIRNFSFRARPISIVETVQLMQKTVDVLNQLSPGIHPGKLVEELTLAKEHLVMASTSDIGKNDSQVSAAFLDKITPDELLSLYKQYLAGVERCNPQLDKLDPAELTKLVEDCKKKANDPESLGSTLIGLSLLQLVNLSRTLLTGG